MRTSSRMAVLGTVLALPTLLSLVLSNAIAWSAPAFQSDPAAQCAEGVRSYLAGNHVEARPWLEAGFTGRDLASFANPNDLGLCALFVGQLKHVSRDYSGALEAYMVAL